MEFNFSKMTNRFHTHSYKWDVEEHELPMWVADMDFETAPVVQEALQNRLNHGIFGYTMAPEAWNEAICGWWKRRYDFTIEPEWLIFSIGVLASVSSIVRKVTTVGENVVLMTPTYNHFYTSVQNNGRNVVENHLTYDAETHQYHIDFANLEEKLAMPQTSLLIFCNPQNPSGNIWDKETIIKVGKLCKKHHVLVLSDEIHCDLTDPGYRYTPFASASETCRDISITCMAPTKTFNIAGIQTSLVMVPNPYLRHKVWRGLNTDEVAEPNAFAVEAAIAAYSKGDAWLDALRAYVQENKRIAVEEIQKHIPHVYPILSHATYLLWLDLREVIASGYGKDAEEVCSRLRKETGLYLNEGGIYGGNGGQFARMNLACPRERLMDGLERLCRGLKQ